MTLPKSKLGLTLSFLYVLASTILILSQGLFGESFVALILGMPWQYFIVTFGLHEVVGLYMWLLTPIIVNVIILYWVGLGIQTFLTRKSS